MQAGLFDRFFIDGDWVLPDGSDRFAVVSPSTEDTLGEIPLGSARDADRALQATRRAFERWSATSPQERAGLLDRVRTLMLERAELFPSRYHKTCHTTIMRIISADGISMWKVLPFIALLVTALPTVVVGQTANTPPPTLGQTAHPPVPEAEAYARTVVRKVKPYLAWQEQSPGAASVKLAANIDDTGAVLSVDILQSSGNDAWDRACAEAVRQASPLPLPPRMSPKNRIAMTFLPKHGW
ncbi:hypothetical protein WL14_04740 [Burkholderia cepacia]|nr:hypothetical protein WL14_04740 [Burkholderia cepacia]